MTLHHFIITSMELSMPFLNHQSNGSWSRDTIQVISEAVFTANHLTDTDKQNSTENTQTTPVNTTQRATNAEYSKTKLAWFSPLTTLGQETR